MPSLNLIGSNQTELIIEYNILVNNLCFKDNKITECKYDFAHFVYEWLKLREKWKMNLNPTLEEEEEKKSTMIYWYE